MKKYLSKRNIFIVIGIFLASLITFVFMNENISEILNSWETTYSKNDNFKGPSEPNIPQDNDRVFNSLIVSPTNPDIVYVGTESNGIFKSIDGGVTWTWPRTGLWHNGRGYPEVYDLIIDPDNESILYAGLTNGAQPPSLSKAAGFYKSIDGGESWERYVSGLPNTAINSVALLDDTLFIGIDGIRSSDYHLIQGQEVPGGIYYSINGGESWELSNIPEAGIFNKYNKIDIRNGVIYTKGMAWYKKATVSGSLYDAENSLGLIKSSDGGDTWETINPEGTAPWYFDTSIDGKVIYFNDGNEGISYKSIDSGETWNEANVMFSNAIKISPHDQDVVMYALGTELYLSKDGLETGNKVHQSEKDMIVNDIEYTSDPNIVYFATDGYLVYKSIDGGESFNEIVNLREFINNYE